MIFFSKSFGQTLYICVFLLVANLITNAKAKIETPNKRTEELSSKPVTALRVPFLLRTPSIKPSLPLSLDPVRFSLQANKDVITEGEEIEITITAQLLDIPASSFFIFEEQKGFSIKLLLPQGFTQTGGDYQEYCGTRLTAQNAFFTRHIRGVFHSLPEQPCFVLLRGAFNAHANSVFEQKHSLCLSKKVIPKATRQAADCVSPWIAVQNKQCGTNSYTLNVILSQDAVLSTNLGQISGTAPNYAINNVPNTSELILTATNCDKKVVITLPVTPCQSCLPPPVTVGASNCYSTTYSFGVDMFNGISLTSNYGTLVGTAPHFAINDISLGQHITLTATSAAGCVSQIIVSGSVCGTTNGGICTAPVLTPIAPQTICYGGAFYTVGTNITNGVEAYYQWYNDNGPANNNTNPIANEQRANLRSFPTAPGVYKYKIVATSAANASCSASQSVTLTVNALPTITSSIGNNPSCIPNFGGTISIAGSGGSSFLFSKDNGGNWVDLTGANAQNEVTRNTVLYTTEKDVAKVKITLEAGFGLGPGGEYTGEIRNETTPAAFEGLAAGTYNIRVKNENGCISEPTTATLTNPNAPAIFSLTGGGLCVANGAPINLSGSSVGVNYTLYKNGIAVTGSVPGTGGALNFANHSAEGTYTVMATNANTNCSAVMNNNVVISNSSPPTAPVSSSNTKILCATNATALEVSVANGQTADWYATSSGGTPLSGGSGVLSFAPNTAGIYYVETRDLTTKCKSTTRTPVTLLAAPTLSITGNATIGCDNPTTTLSAQTSTGFPANTSVSYSWKNNASNAVVATTPTLNVTEAATYTMTLSYEGCSLAASQTVSKNSTDPTATLVGSTKLSCSGEVSLLPTLTNTNTNTSYEWSGPDGFTASTTNVNVTKPGIYTLLLKKNGTTPCSTTEVFVEDKPQTPQAPELSATQLTIDPESSTTLLARGCASAVRWSYIPNDPAVGAASTPINQDPQTAATSLSIVESVTTPELPLSYQTTSYQTSATYTAACVGQCGLSTASLPITIFKNICGIKVQADKNAVSANTPVTLIAFLCEAANITWSTGQTGTKTITVTPSATTTYFAVCKLPSTGASCSSSVEVSVSAADCPSNFAITASTTNIQKGDIVTLTANGCTGSLSWSNGVNNLATASLKVMPETTTDYYAICTNSNGNSCFSNSIKVTVNSLSSANCNIYINVLTKTNYTFKKDRWNLRIFFGGCPNGQVLFSKEGTSSEPEGNNGGWYIGEILGDITVKVSCVIEGNTVCEKSLLIPEPTDSCFGNALYFKDGSLYNPNEANTFILFDENGKKINQVAASSVKIPISIVDKIYTAKFTNNCPDLSTRVLPSSFMNQIVWYEGNSPSVIYSDTREVGQYSYDFNSNYLLRMAMNPNSSCKGQVVWSNNQDPTFHFTGPELFFQNSNAYVVTSNGTNIEPPFLPFPRTTTTYYATCYYNGTAFPASNSKTLVVNSFGECIRITPKVWQIAQGNSIEWAASGCLGQVTWSINGTNIGTGNTIVHTPIVPTTPTDVVYTATCTNPACSQTGKIRVQPCQVTITASKNLVKLAEPVSLTSSGCSGGQIVWSTGEITRSIVVKPLATTSYTAQCKVENQLLCASNNLTVTIEAQPPVDIQCSTDFSLSAPTNFVKCTTSPVTITPIGCPTGSTILWQNSVTQPYNEPYKFTPQSTTTITAVCVSPYGTQFNATASIEIVATNTLSVSSTDVAAGIPTIVSATGCATNSCQEGTYRWKNAKGEIVFVGSNYKVTLLEPTTYTITCDQGGSVSVTLNPKKEGDCKIAPSYVLYANNGYLMLSAKNCDANQPIYWYKKTGKIQYPDPNNLPTWQLAYTNVKKITEVEPGLDQWIAYAVVCTSNTKLCYTEESFGRSLDGKKDYSWGSNSITIAIGGGDPTTPDPCSVIPAGEKGKRNDYAGIHNLNRFRLLTNWCPGTQVEWFLDGTKIATLPVPDGYVDVPHDWSTYTYVCKLSNGPLCEGEYELPTPPAKAPDGGRIAANLSSPALVDCPSTLPLSTPLAVELASLICAHLELLKNTDGSMSSVKVAAFLAALKASVSSRYAASGITVSFPADDAAVIAAIMAQNCTQAGHLLAAPNTATVTPTQFNTVKNATHQPILDDLKGVLIQQCSSSQAPPLAMTDSNAPNGRLAAYVIDYNRLFIAPDGRAVKLPAGATPKFFTFSFSWYAPPAGTLQGFETASKVQYFAEILSGSGIFKGYRRSSPLCPEEYYNEPLYVTAPTAPAPVYYFQLFTQSPDCGYKWIEATHIFAPTIGQVTLVPTLLGPNTNTTYLPNCDPIVQYLKASQLKNWLSSKNMGKGAVYLANCNSGKVTLVTSTTESEQANLTPEQAKTKVLNRDFTTDFAIYACKQTDGSWDITHNFKTGALAIPQGENYTGTIAEVETRSNEAAQTVLQNNGVRGQSVDDELFYEELDIIKALVVVKDATLTLCNQAKVPEKFWDDKNSPDYPQAPFHGPTLSGVGDGAIAELKDIPELVGFGLEIATDPTKAKATWNGIKSMTPAKVKKMLLGAAADKIAKYTGGGNTMKHEAGKDGVQLAMFVFGGITKIKDGADLVDDLGTEVVAKLDNVADEALSKIDDAIDADAGKSINKMVKEGVTPPNLLEYEVPTLQAAKTQKGSKLTKTETEQLILTEKSFVETGDLDEIANTLTDLPDGSKPFTKGTTGGWNKTVNKHPLEPNKQYVSQNLNEKYITDANGRVNEVNINSISANTVPANGYQRRKAVTAKGGDKTNDQGGHLLAARFGGAGEQINLVPMSKNINQSGGSWYQMEQRWANALAQPNGKVENIKIKILDYDTNGRPGRFEVTFSINGVTETIPHFN